jgi:hypothetical protein
MTNFLFFIIEKYFTIIKNFLEIKINVLKSFYFNLKMEYIAKTYKFHPGRRTYKAIIKRPKRRKAIVIQKDPFENNRMKLLEESEKYYIQLGKFINEYSNENVHLDWNDFIWTPYRELKHYIQGIENSRSPTLPPTPSVSEFSSPPETPKNPIHRALRAFKQYPDVAAENDEERCKICMINKKCIIFLPCAHVGICNSCCAEIYKQRFMTSIYVKKPYLSDRLPLPPKRNILDAEDEDEFIHNIIQELTAPMYHYSKKCVFCKEKIILFKIFYSV